MEQVAILNYSFHNSFEPRGCAGLWNSAVALVSGTVRLRWFVKQCGCAGFWNSSVALSTDIFDTFWLWPRFSSSIEKLLQGALAKRFLQTMDRIDKRMDQNAEMTGAILSFIKKTSRVLAPTTPQSSATSIPTPHRTLLNHKRLYINLLPDRRI